MTEVSSTRLYLGNLPKGVTKADVEKHFETHGTGEITEIKLMSGFGFIEYKDAMDARDVVPGSRHRDGGMLAGPGVGGGHERSAPRPRRTPYRMQITGLPNDTSWQDLKDFARQSSLDVVYSETGRHGNGGGFVEFETAADLRAAVEKLDGREFKGQTVTCVPDTQPDFTGRDRIRSRSPRGRGGYAPPGDIYDRRGPPRGYSPRRGDYRESYRERSPRGGRGEYYDDRRYGRSPPRRTALLDDYPPPRGRYDDPYRRDYGPPPAADPYTNGRAYERPVRDIIPPRGDLGYGPRDGAYPRDEYRRGGGAYW